MEKTAMKCNSKQFKHIKPKLKEAGIDIFMISEFKEGSYLCFFSDKSVTNGVIQFRNTYTKIYDEWDEETFLKICGIKPKEKTYKITREQILKYNMKDEFPEVFETKLTVGKWYKYKTKHFNWLMCYTGIDGKNYGFNTSGTFGTDFEMDLKTEWKEATEQEVTEALTKEAVKRGFVGNKYIDISALGFKNDDLITGGQLEYKDGWLNFGELRTAIFHNGVWGSVIPTLTIQEAEAKLNCKII